MPGEAFTVCPKCCGPLKWVPSLISSTHGECETAFCSTCNVVHARGNDEAVRWLRMVWRNSSREVAA